MRWIGLAAILAALVVSVTSYVEAAEKTVVNVVFELADRHYTDELGTEGTADLRASGATAVAEVFSERFGFLEFQSGAASQYTLTVRLGRAEGLGTENTEFGFHISLSGPDVPQDAKNYLVFRTKDQYLAPIGTPETLTAEIRGRMAQIGRDFLIHDVLHYISIADAGEFVGSPVWVWLIDRNRNQLCITDRSSLEVVASMPKAAVGRVSARFVAVDTVVEDPEHPALRDAVSRSKIIATPMSASAQEMLEVLRSAEPSKVVIKRVFVLRYEPECPPQPTPPSEVDFLSDGSPP